jgi:soluble cytochrome b562
MSKLLKYNLQLFAEDSENLEESADLDIDTQNDGVDGDPQPEVEIDPVEQSKDKENPANHAFAEMRRRTRELENELNQTKQRQKEVDDYYASLARDTGRNDISTAEDYFKAVRADELVNKYKEEQDPMALVELLKQSIMPELKASIPQPVQPTYDFEPELKAFNEEFNQNLADIDDILKLENSDKVLQYMNKNNLGLAEAYKLANPKKIVAATKQAAINQLKGHNHVKGNSAAGKIDEISVSTAEINTWKARHGRNKTDEQCRKEITEIKKLFTD